MRRERWELIQKKTRKEDNGGAPRGSSGPSNKGPVHNKRGERKAGIKAAMRRVMNRERRRQ